MRALAAGPPRAPAARLGPPVRTAAAPAARRAGALPPPPLLPRTKWSRRVPHPVLIGHAASLTPYAARG